MRLLIRLRSTENTPYEMQYHYHLQGFIYNLVKDSKYDYIHNKEGYKFFCFSNIFPAKELHEDDIRTLIVSSPDTDFIQSLYETLQLSLGRGVEVKIGIMKFKIDSIQKLAIKVPESLPFSLISGTPIVVRIRREKYELYVPGESKDYDYIYWRSNYPIELFISQVENNLFKKYTEYSMFNTDKCSRENYDNISSHRPLPVLFQKFKFKKQISTRVFMKGVDQIVIATVWEFAFNNTFIDHKLVQFALDAGLGERNSLGFGFMNLLPN
jgi:CRISPR-associated endoribonuclease Cas6